MPELPEVEIVRRGLASAMEGASFAAVTLNRADLRFPFQAGFVERLQNKRVIRLSRRAKYIIAETDSDLRLGIHLGMTGRFTVERGVSGVSAPSQFYYKSDANPRHDHVIFSMSNGDVVRYNDVRRFGYMTLFVASEAEEHPLFKGLGVEPLSEDLNPSYLARRALDRKQALKAFLLDQRVIAGLGNIYVCEALFRARLGPEAQAGMLAIGKQGKAASSKLCSAVKGVLADALAAGGSSLRDYRHADGGSGAFQDKFDVYGRAGKPCHNGCGGTIERKVQQGRSSFFCPCCQI